VCRGSRAFRCFRRTMRPTSRISLCHSRRERVQAGRGGLPDATCRRGHRPTSRRCRFAAARAWTSDADRDGSEPVLLVSNRVRQSFAGADPIGKQVMFLGTANRTGLRSWRGGRCATGFTASKPAPTFYVPIAQHPRRATDMQLMVRTHIDAAAITATMTRFMTRQFPQVAVQGATMLESIGESERAQHFRTLLFGSFAGVSILLAMTGMFG